MSTSLDEVIVDNSANLNKTKPKGKDYIYLPIALYIDKEFPSEVKKELYNISSALLSKGYVIRLPADEDKDIYEKLRSLSNDKVEGYLPWKDFDTIKDGIFQQNKFASIIVKNEFKEAYVKLPNVVKAKLERNVKLLIGTDTYRSGPAIALITWSKDKAKSSTHVTKETGRAGFLISIASKFGIKIYNIEDKNDLLSINDDFKLSTIIQ